MRTHAIAASSAASLIADAFATAAATGTLAEQRERIVPVPRQDPPRRVLVAEDNHSMRRLIARALSSAGHKVVEACNGFELMHWVDLMTTWTPVPPIVDLVVTDHRMPMFTGLECIEHLRFCGSRIPVILITAFGDPVLYREAHASGARRVLDKPLDLATLRDEVNRLLA